MARVDPDKDAFKQALKEGFTETLHEQRELLHEIVALAEAIREGRRSDLAEHSEVFDILKNRT
jgi:hypothetical protein